MPPKDMSDNKMIAPTAPDGRVDDTAGALCPDKKKASAGKIVKTIGYKLMHA